MEISVSYGDGKIAFDIPERNLAGKIVPNQPDLIADVEGELQRVLNNPHGPSLADLSKSKSVCVLVEDHTRDEPHWELLNAVAPFLKNANLVQFIITTGSHEVEHPENLKIVNMISKVAETDGLNDYRIKINDCKDTDVVNLGTTSRGTPVVVTSRAINHDVYVALADMKAHYFAGYSNALKDFLPGVCAFETIEANHAMALDSNSTFGRHPYHPDNERRNNPLADDMREATEIITKGADTFTLSVISDGKQLVWAEAGRLEPVIAGGIEVLDKTASFTVKPTPRIVISPGGWPQDKSLYHAQRGLELTKNAVQDKGEILFLAECKDGVAPETAFENFYRKLTAPIDDVLESIRGRYHLYEHKAYKFAELLKRVSDVKMYTKLDRPTVESAHLTKSENPQEVVDAWIRQDSSVKILVLDKGNKLAVYPI